MTFNVFNAWIIPHYITFRLMCCIADDEFSSAIAGLSLFLYKDAIDGHELQVAGEGLKGIIRKLMNRFMWYLLGCL